MAYTLYTYNYLINRLHWKPYTPHHGCISKVSSSHGIVLAAHKLNMSIIYACTHNQGLLEPQ